MKSSILFWTFFSLIALAWVPPAQSLSPQRCNGIIQYRPCGQELANGSGNRKARAALPNRSSAKASPRADLFLARSRTASQFYAEVVKQTMSPLANSIGQWRGTLRGNGVVHLRLLWYRNGLLSSTRYMGTVKLVNKVTSFAFRSSFPHGSGWTWKVAAYATKTS